MGNLSASVLLPSTGFSLPVSRDSPLRRNHWYPGAPVSSTSPPPHSTQTHTHTPQPWAEVSITPLAPCFPTRSPAHCCVLASRAATPSGRDCRSCFTCSFADCAVDRRAPCTVPIDATTHSVKKSSSGPCQFSSVRFGSGSVQFKMVIMVVIQSFMSSDLG